MTKLSIAPMIDWTNTYFRTFMRLLCPNALLYTEMLTTGALLNHSHRALEYNDIEHPLALQLGGNDPEQLSLAACLAESLGYDEINLNVGCPSPRVQSGAFGACLMAEPELVARCVKAMKDKVSLPVTVKTRIGIDDQDSFEFLNHFVQCVKQVGCQTVIIHARKAWLKGLNPKQNRTIPPLHYDTVYQIKQLHQELTIIINGGINDLKQVNDHLKQVDGVMLGRLAMNEPYRVAEIDAVLHGTALPNREEVLEKYLGYCEDKLSRGSHLSLLLKPVFALYNGLPGAKAWRQQLTTFVQTKSLDRRLLVPPNTDCVAIV